MNQSISIYKKWSPNEALIRAAKRGKMDLLQTALRAGADINHVSETDPNTALSLACSHGKTAIIEHLLKQGATISVEYVPPLPLPPPPSSSSSSSLSLSSQQTDTLEIIDMDDYDYDMDNPKHETTSTQHQQVPEVDGTTVVLISAAVAAAIHGWPDILKLLVQSHQANVVEECGSISYGEENVLLACAHQAHLRCLEVILHSKGAEAMWPEALEHVSFAPSILDDTILPSPTDLWWIPIKDTTTLPLLSLRNDKKHQHTPQSNKSNNIDIASSNQEISQRIECRNVLLNVLKTSGRLEECLPYMRQTWNGLVKHAEIDSETGENVPTIPLFVGHYVLADILERIDTQSSLLEAANLYGLAYQMSKKLFGNNEVTITSLGNWSACILRITQNSRNPIHNLHKEGEPMLRAALKDLKTRCNINTNDARVIRWQGILLPLQPGRAPFEPMSYLHAEEMNPYYKSPPRTTFSTHKRVEDHPIPFPSEQALHPSQSPFLDELEIVKNILEQLHSVNEELNSQNEDNDNNNNSNNKSNKKKAATLELSERSQLMEAVKKNWRCIQFSHCKYRKDFGIAMTAVSFHGIALQCVDVTLQNNPKIVIVAVENNWRSFSYATPYLKRKKKIYQAAKQGLLDEINSGTEKSEAWRCLEFADPMLRGDMDVVEAALNVSEDAFQFVDRYIYAESVSWKKIWPKFIRRCKRRIMMFIITLIIVAAIVATAYICIYVIFFTLIWPPTICQETNITFIKKNNSEIYMQRVVFEVEFPYNHRCNASLYSPAPAPKLQEVSQDDREREREKLAELMKEEQTKVAAEEKEKERRRLNYWHGNRVPSPSPFSSSLLESKERVVYSYTPSPGLEKMNMYGDKVLGRNARRRRRINL